MKMNNSLLSVFAAAVMMTGAFCVSGADPKSAGDGNDGKRAVAETRPLDAESKPGSGGRQEALRKKLLVGLRPENLSAEELENIRSQMRVMFGPNRKVDDLSAVEIVRLWDRVLITAESGDSGANPRPGGRPGGGSAGRPNSGEEFGPRPDRERRPRGQNGPPNFGWRGGSPGGPPRSQQPFGPAIYPESGPFVAPFFQGVFEEESNVDPEAAIRAYETMIKRYDHQRRNISIAVFRLGEIYRKAGENGNAKKQYDRIMKEFSDQEDIREQSEKALAEIAKKP